MSETGGPAVNDSPAPPSPFPADATSVPHMGKPGTRSVLYRLIEAGQLARRALILHLAEHGLEPGDDALLLLLEGEGTAAEHEIEAALGIDSAQLDQRLQRLAVLRLVERRAIGPELVPGATLTEDGRTMRGALERHWSKLEDAMTDRMTKKQQKRLRKVLGRFAKQLRS